MTVPLLLALGLAVYRVTRLIVKDEIAAPLRRSLANAAYPKGADGQRAPRGRVLVVADKVINCPWCCSLWVSAPMTTLTATQGQWWRWTCVFLAAAGVASAIEDLSGGR